MDNFSRRCFNGTVTQKRFREEYEDPMGFDDVPSPVDFHDPRQAEHWVENTTKKRPWRVEFFGAFVAQIDRHFDQPVAVLEVGSGPGLLAEHILRRCNVRSYALLDFSMAMHELARERLEGRLDRASFLHRSFQSANWVDGLDEYDAIVTMEAIHEVRQKKHIPPLLDQIHGLIRDGGCFFFCDHYYAEGNSGKNPDLYLTREEQVPALESAGFQQIELLLDKGEMALYRARKTPRSPKESV